MITLASLLVDSQNGSKILEEAKKLGFNSIQLLKTPQSNTLCLIVDSKDLNTKIEADSQNISLMLRIAKIFNCKTEVINKNLMSKDNLQNLENTSLELPILDKTLLKNIFGDVEKIALEPLNADPEYQLLSVLFGDAPDSDKTSEKSSHSIPILLSKLTKHGNKCEGSVAKKINAEDNALLFLKK